MKNNKTNKPSHLIQSALILKFFKLNPSRDIAHPEIVDWATREYNKKTKKVLRDPDRAIRKLHQDGYLVKVSNGVYRYDPSLVKKRNLEDFTPALKKAILQRDGYKCVICGKGAKDGAVLHIDHIKPKDLGGKATIENGQTLCSRHNFLKKNFKQTETGKKYFIRLYELAKSENNKELVKFCAKILEVFEENNMNGHIEWKK